MFLAFFIPMRKGARSCQSVQTATRASYDKVATLLTPVAAEVPREEDSDLHSRTSEEEFPEQIYATNSIHPCYKSSLQSRITTVIASGCQCRTEARYEPSRATTLFGLRSYHHYWQHWQTVARKSI
jgi:hypothetical protein